MENRKTIRIGMLGFGSMGKTHTFAVRNLPFYYESLPFDAQVAGVCTSHAESAEKASCNFDIPRFTTDEDELINAPDIDVIDICTPNLFHYETLKKSILAGKHVYCEKPLCTSLAQAREIVALAKERPDFVGKIVFNNRFLAPIQRAKRLVDEGRLGRILSFSARYLHSSALDPTNPIGWKQDKSICGGGVLFDLGSHVIDLIYYLCGAFASVCTATQTVYPERVYKDGGLRATDADEAFYMLAQLKNGAVGTVSASKIIAGANDDLTLEIFGEKGSLRFSLMDPNFLHFFDNSLPDTTLGGSRGYTAIECVGRYPRPGGSFPSPKAPVGWLRGHVESMYCFLNSVFEGRSSAPDFLDALHVQSVMEAAYRSASSNHWESVEDAL